MIHNSPKTLSILLIEDNPADRRLAEIALDEAAMEGHVICDLRTAGTLAEGLACLNDATCGVILIDLDRFKDINDLFGHQTGDEVLVAIADALKTVLSENDSAARIGGDEFAMLLRDVETEEDAFRRTDEILVALKAICMLNDGRFGVHFSVGVSLISFGKTETSTLISRADHALYKSKQTKDTAVVLYDAQMDASFNEKQVLKQKMATDIQENRFYLDFQPIVDAGNHSIVAAEVLLAGVAKTVLWSVRLPLFRLQKRAA